MPCRPLSLWFVEAEIDSVTEGLFFTTRSRTLFVAQRRRGCDLMHTPEIATSQSKPVWHIGRFACLLSLQSEPPFLAVLKDDESILEVTVHSALEATERANALRVIVQEYLT